METLRCIAEHKFLNEGKALNKERDKETEMHPLVNNELFVRFKESEEQCCDLVNIFKLYSSFIREGVWIRKGIEPRGKSRRLLSSK